MSSIFKIKEEKIYHKCQGSTDWGIVEIKTDSGGYIEARCRNCGKAFRISDIIRHITMVR